MRRLIPAFGRTHFSLPSRRIQDAVISYEGWSSAPVSAIPNQTVVFFEDSQKFIFLKSKAGVKVGRKAVTYTLNASEFRPFEFTPAPDASVAGVNEKTLFYTKVKTLQCELLNYDKETGMLTFKSTHSGLEIDVPDNFLTNFAASVMNQFDLTGGIAKVTLDESEKPLRLSWQYPVRLLTTKMQGNSYTLETGDVIAAPSTIRPPSPVYVSLNTAAFAYTEENNVAPTTAS